MSRPVSRPGGRYPPRGVMNVMFCHAGRRKDCRQCHEMSCSGCRRRIGCRIFGHEASPFDPSSFPSPGHRFSRVAGPFTARIARGRARPSAPARFARLIARAREAGAGRTSPLCFSGVFFRAGANRERSRRPGRRFLASAPIWLSAPGGQDILGIITEFANNMRSSIPAAACREWRSAPPCGKGPPCMMMQFQSHCLGGDRTCYRQLDRCGSAFSRRFCSL